MLLIPRNGLFPKALNLVPMLLILSSWHNCVVVKSLSKRLWRLMWLIKGSNKLFKKKRPLIYFYYFFCKFCNIKKAPNTKKKGAMHVQNKVFFDDSLVVVKQPIPVNGIYSFQFVIRALTKRKTKNLSLFESGWVNDEQSTKDGWTLISYSISLLTLFG